MRNFGYAEFRVCEILGMRNGCAEFWVCEISGMRDFRYAKWMCEILGCAGYMVCRYVSFINLFRTSQKIYNFKRQGSPVSRFTAYLFFGVRKTAHYIQQPDNIK